MFNTRNVGKTLVTRTQGTKVRAGEGRGGVICRRAAGCAAGAHPPSQQQPGVRSWHCATAAIAACARHHPSPACARARPTLLQIASDGLKGRVIEVSLADLQNVRRWLADCGSAGGVAAL